MISSADFQVLRLGIAEIPADLSNDAIGAFAPKLEDMFAPESHASALDPYTPIIVGSRGAGKSFWSGVLGQQTTKAAAASAYPRLGLADVKVYFGYTGVGGAQGIGVEALNSCIPPGSSKEVIRAFWWATILRAIKEEAEEGRIRLADAMEITLDWERRDEIFDVHESRLKGMGTRVLVIFDALDTVAIEWSRRRELTEGLLEVVWATRAYRHIKVKLFLRPDQIDDDALQFVELPKLRTGAVRLAWSGEDLYGLFFSRLALSKNDEVKKAFSSLCLSIGIPPATSGTVLGRQWPLVSTSSAQIKAMESMSGPYMASGTHGYKKGRTYTWPLTHLADAFDEVTPRSFLGLLIAAAKSGATPENAAITPEGIRHGLRAASKTRVDQLHLEFPWIKGVLAPLSGLLLPQEQEEVFKFWRAAKTKESVIRDAADNNYLPPFPSSSKVDELSLFKALEKIGVMFRRKDERLDMPDLFRVAARLLKKGGTAPT